MPRTHCQSTRAIFGIYSCSLNMSGWQDARRPNRSAAIGILNACSYFKNHCFGNRSDCTGARRVGDIRAGKAPNVGFVHDGQALGNLHCCHCEAGFGVSPDRCRAGISISSRFSSVGAADHCRCNRRGTHGPRTNSTIPRLVFRAVFCAGNQIVAIVWNGFRRFPCLWSSVGRVASIRGSWGLARRRRLLRDRTPSRCRSSRDRCDPRPALT